MIKNKLFIVLIVLLTLGAACTGPREEAVEIDFSPGNSTNDNIVSEDSLPVLSVAIAPVISPRESFIYYKELFDYMAENLNMRIEYRQRLSYGEVNELLKRNQVDIAFICTGSYTEDSDGMDLLVTPMVRGQFYYQAYVIAHVSSEINQFSDLQGRSFAYTDRLSTTGKLFPLSRIRQLGLDTTDFFSSTIYTSSHDVSIQMVARNLIDGASVNGLIFDYLNVNQPLITRNLRIIEKSENYGIPPIVSSLLLDGNLKMELQQMFLDMHNDPKGRDILNKLQIDSFEIVGDTLYQNIPKLSEIAWQ